MPECGQKANRAAISRSTMKRNVFGIGFGMNILKVYSNLRFGSLKTLSRKGYRGSLTNAVSLVVLGDPEIFLRDTLPVS